MKRISNDSSAPSGALGRRRLTVLVALLALTIAGGVAARSFSSRPAPAPPAPGALPLTFGPTAQGPISFGARLDRGAVYEGVGGQVRVELEFGADGRKARGVERLPTDLVVVLDRSGSMNGAPLQHAAASVRELISQLASGDRFALVAYASGADLVVPLAEATPESRRTWQGLVAGLHASGGTHMASGLDLATATLASASTRGRAARIILLSDGHANQGDHSLEGLRSRAARAVAGEYVVSTVGVGSGFDEVLMSALADSGTGNFYYVESAHGLGEVFAGEFASARETVASALEVRMDPGTGIEVVDAAGYPLQRQADGSVVFRPGSLFAGQDRRVWLTLRVDPAANASADGGDVPLGRLSLSWSDPAALGERRRIELGGPLQVAWVQTERDFFARVDAESYERAIDTDALNALKQKVAGAVRSGDRAKAEAQIDDYVARNRAFYHSQGRDETSAPSFARAQALKKRVTSAFEAPAAVAEAEQNRLGKTLQEEGVDGRRLGAKY